MTPLYTQEQFNQAKSRDLLPLQCEHCNNTYTKAKNRILTDIQRNIGGYCSSTCHNHYKTLTMNVSVTCKQCNKPSTRWVSQSKKYKNHFCNSSCAATYHNTHKTTGYRRSKLEKWLEEQLITKYPTLDFKFNDKVAITSELDIYMPSLKLAFELNGIFHYEPIFGSTQLSKIQNNDNRKMLACAEKGISLCVIDTSSYGYFKPLTAQKYLDIVTTIIDKLVNLTGFEPA